MLNTLQLALAAKARANEFVAGVAGSRKKIVSVSILRPVYELEDIRHAYLQGFIAALEEMRREQEAIQTTRREHPCELAG